jgi:hypothetical protein
MLLRREKCVALKVTDPWPANLQTLPIPNTAIFNAYYYYYFR